MKKSQNKEWNSINIELLILTALINNEHKFNESVIACSHLNVLEGINQLSANPYRLFLMIPHQLEFSSACQVKKVLFVCLFTLSQCSHIAGLNCTAEACMVLKEAHSK